jgi:NAD+ kinase
VRRPESITIFTHRDTDQTAAALQRVLEMAVDAGVEVRIPADEVEKHCLDPREGLDLGADADGRTDLAVVLGGDGTILSTLRRYAGREVPVFAFNYGAIGFLATVEHAELEDGMRRALEGDFDVLDLPALSATTSGGGEQIAVNDISFHRRHNGRVAELGYRVEGQRLGEVRSDGLVVATPAGSTGYNLANGGPVLAWGVEGYVVSFIAPHTLTARALVVAPGDELEVTNNSDEDPVDMTTDGRAVGEVAPRGEVRIAFRQRAAMLAQMPGASFYQRMRDKFGRLAT